LLYEKNFGESLGLETFEDEIRNVIIRKLHRWNGKPQAYCDARSP
jgi:uncharacterized Fe-S cluster-containing MiaB family protein